MTPDEVSQALADAGIDTPAKLTEFVTKAGAALERSKLVSQIAALQNQQYASANAVAGQVQALQARVAALDSELSL